MVSFSIRDNGLLMGVDHRIFHKRQSYHIAITDIADRLINREQTDP